MSELVSAETIASVEAAEERRAFEAEIRADERRRICKREGHDWRVWTTVGERAVGIEREVCARCGAKAVTKREVEEAE